MSRRGNKRRQTGRKARNREREVRMNEEPDRSCDEPFTEARRQRNLLRFTNLVSRGMTLSFVSLGITVRATTPEELRQETANVLAELTKGQTPS